MADSRRGGRSNDDEFEEAELEAFDDDSEELDDGDLDDEFQDDATDHHEDEDEVPASRNRSRAAARTKMAAKSTKVARPKKTTREDVGPGILGRIIRFVREVVAELQKVIWPTRKELVTYTTVVVVFVTIVMTLVALLDVGFLKTMFAVFGGQTISNPTQ